jgi:hypothetical protein
MSIKVMTQVWEYSMASGNDLMVLLAIADNANDAGIAFPSVPTLADKARISESTVKRSVKFLVGLGELRIEIRGGTRQIKELNGSIYTQRWSNRYQVIKGKRVSKEKFTIGQVEPHSGVTALNPTRGSQLRTGNHHKELPKKMTKIAVAENDHAPDAVVVSFVCEEDLCRDIVDKLNEEFALSEEQGRDIEQDIRINGTGRALQAAEVTREEPRQNAGQTYMAAFNGRWARRKTTVKEKPVAQARRHQSILEPFKEPTKADVEMRLRGIAGVRAAVGAPEAVR